jgi:PhnB protein
LTANVGKLIDLLQRVFDAREAYRMTLPDGSVPHAQVHIGESSIMIGTSPPGHAHVPGMLYVYVPDVDSVYQRAVEAGASSVSEVADMFYGDRVGAVKDFAGNQWWIATHTQDVPEEELTKRAAAARAQRES